MATKKSPAKKKAPPKRTPSGKPAKAAPEPKHVVKHKEWSRVTLYLPPDTHRRLRVLSAETGREHSDIAVKALEAYFAKQH